MDTGSKNDTVQQKRNKDATNFQSPNMSLNWQLSGSNLTNASMVMIPSSNPLVDSNFPTIWDRPTNLPHLSFYGNNGQINPCTMNQHETAAIDSGPARGGMSWNPLNAMLKGLMLVPPFPGMIPQSLAQLPADSGFIERAARFSCFSGGNFSDMMNPFSVPESTKPCNRALAPTWRTEEVFASNGLNSPSVVDSQKQNMQSGVDSSKDVSLSNENKANEQSPLKNEKKNEIFATSQNEGKESVGLSGNESDEAECSGRQEEMGSAGLESSVKDLGSRKRKRKRYGQDTELDRMKGAQQLPAKPEQGLSETQKGDGSLNLPSSKHGGKNSEQRSQSSDPPKEEYIHVRARRGQATNSHSLAERVRREKISERMKFLQDLVPGCDKVTGKAVMLDEIINYVQSLQRQVEFLSMKLSTVNPWLDFNLDGLLAKDSQAGPSSSLVFPPDNMTMIYNSLHGWQSGLLQSGFPGDVNCVDAFWRSINSQVTSMSGGYRDPSSQVPNAWDAQLHNVVDMGFNSITPLDCQDLSSLPPDQMKTEP